jgi:hypothetical protein
MARRLILMAAMVISGAVLGGISGTGVTAILDGPFMRYCDRVASNANYLWIGSGGRTRRAYLPG